MKKILIVKLGDIGDVIECLYLYDYIKKANQNIEIHWLVGVNSIPILQRYGVDKIYTIDSNGLIYGNILKKVINVVKSWKKISFKKFDAIYLCHRDYKYRLLTCFTYKETFSQLNNFTNMNRILEYINLFDINKKDVNINPIRFNRINNIFERAENDFIVALAPGGVEHSSQRYNKWIRQWQIEKYVELAKFLIDKKCRVILTGDKNDFWVEKYFYGLSVESYIGKTDLNETIDLYASVDCVVTVDSGPMHLACLSGSEVIILFGPTNSSTIAPPGENVHVINSKIHLNCSPCYDGRNYAKCESKDCLKNIEAIEVLQMINELLRKKM